MTDAGLHLPLPRAVGRCLAAAAAVVLLALAAAGPAQAQQRAARFYVDSVADSTFVFRVGDAGWIRRGQTGIAVDPGQRDALVARFRIVDVSRDRATALITGQTTFLTGQHVALVEQPRRPFWRRGLFWSGSVVGAALGLAAGMAF